VSVPTDNETWVIERGDTIIQKKAHSGVGSLGTWEKLVYCLWVADYGMRNAGDLDTAHDVYADFLAEGRRIAGELSLSVAHQVFSMPQHDLEQAYFHRFDSLCAEIRNAEPGAPPNGGPAQRLENPAVGGEPPSVS
jgi:hypothetical protein